MIVLAASEEKNQVYTFPRLENAEIFILYVFIR